MIYISMLLSLMLMLVSGISPYIRVAEKAGPMNDVVDQVTTVLEDGGYEIVCDSKETAVFGIGMEDKEKGEAHFLPIIGESHVAAMPYEIILQGNEVTMLHGRFRFALHWPELTMGTFMKIKSAPGDVEDAMKRNFETD